MVQRDSNGRFMCPCEFTLKIPRDAIGVRSMQYSWTPLLFVFSKLEQAISLVCLQGTSIFFNIIILHDIAGYLNKNSSLFVPMSFWVFAGDIRNVRQLKPHLYGMFWAQRPTDEAEPTPERQLDCWVHPCTCLVLWQRSTSSKAGSRHLLLYMDHT